MTILPKHKNLNERDVFVEWDDPHSGARNLGSCSRHNKQKVPLEIFADVAKTSVELTLPKIKMRISNRDRLMAFKLVLSSQDLDGPSAMSINYLSDHSPLVSQAARNAAQEPRAKDVIQVKFRLSRQLIVARADDGRKAVRTANMCAGTLLLNLQSLSCASSFTVYIRDSDYAKMALLQLQKRILPTTTAATIVPTSCSRATLLQNLFGDGTKTLNGICVVFKVDDRDSSNTRVCVYKSTSGVEPAVDPGTRTPLAARAEQTIQDTADVDYVPCTPPTSWTATDDITRIDHLSPTPQPSVHGIFSREQTAEVADTNQNPLPLPSPPGHRFREQAVEVADTSHTPLPQPSSHSHTSKEVAVCTLDESTSVGSFEISSDECPDIERPDCYYEILRADSRSWLNLAAELGFRDMTRCQFMNTPLKTLGLYMRTNNVKSFDLLLERCSARLLFEAAGGSDDVRTASDVMEDLVWLVHLVDDQERGAHMQAPFFDLLRGLAVAGRRAVMVSGPCLEDKNYVDQRNDFIVHVIGMLGSPPKLFKV